MLRRTDDILRRRGGPASAGELAALALLWSAAYGATMGTFGGFADGRALQVLYSALKVPLLFLTTVGLCLPVFLVANTLLGLRGDFPTAVRALLHGQVAVAVVLSSCAPFTVMVYLSTRSYSGVLLWNGALFALASLAGHVALRRLYRPLIARDLRHRAMLRLWSGLYVLVAIQLAWVLRPFVGSPWAPVELFRAESWGNAYVVVLRLISKTLAGG